jgi:hypothetical protein
MIFHLELLALRQFPPFPQYWDMSYEILILFSTGSALQYCKIIGQINGTVERDF